MTDDEALDAALVEDLDRSLTDDGEDEEPEVLNHQPKDEDRLEARLGSKAQTHRPRPQDGICATAP